MEFSGSFGSNFSIEKPKAPNYSFLGLIFLKKATGSPIVEH
jgi:hypothetical protein